MPAAASSQEITGSNPKLKKVGAEMKGEREQDQNRNKNERPFKYRAGDRTIGVEMSQSATVASAAAEFLAEGERANIREPLNRSYVRRPGERPSCLVLRSGDGAVGPWGVPAGTSLRNGVGQFCAGV
ncbi:hypothetical protein AMQ83_21750 [Paenibacillus riograndensis]|nr:hypothetical protein AMQ83_21750 [Paenibacillus riograndensis]